MRIDLLTFIQIVRNNFALEQYSKLFSFNNLFAMSAKFPFVSKRVLVPRKIDLLKFNYEHLEKIVARGQGSFGVHW